MPKWLPDTCYSSYFSHFKLTLDKVEAVLIAKDKYLKWVAKFCTAQETCHCGEET